MPTIRAARPAAMGKLRAPRLGRVFGRERLFAELDAQAGTPGLWIAGPPGIGKTTLVATYLQARGVASLWLQLDAGDADPASFVHFLWAAAAAARPGLALRPPSPGADELREVPGLVRRQIQRLVQALDGPWALVLDNLQDLGPAAAIHAGLAAALADLPEHARLIAISREPPPAAYARALAGQQLALLDERALRFDDSDAQQLLALHGRAWPAAALRQATDGWAAAMILLLATRAELGPDEALRSGGARARLFAYFAGEVLAGMSAADAAALMRIAFLPSATAAMAVAISGDAQAGDLLAGLARRSLFTDCRDGRPPAYSFHALFSAFLRERAAEVLPAPALQDLRIAAAGLLAAQGQADAAIGPLIEAGAGQLALDLILLHAPRFLAQGRTAMLHDWLVALPEALQAAPQATYWRACCVLAADPREALRHLESAYRGFQRHPEADPDGRGAFCCAAAAADAIVSIGADLHALDAWMPLLQRHAAAYLAQRDALTDLRVLPGLLAAFVHRATGHALTAPLADAAERLLDQPLGAGQRILLGTLAYYLLWTGQTARLDRMIIKIDRLCAAPDAAPGTLLRWYGVSVLIRALLGRVAESMQHARLALALAAAGPPAMRARAHLLLVLAAIAGRDAGLARSELAQAAVGLDAAHPIDATTYEFQRGLLMLLDADWTGADQLMRAAVASGRASGWPLREHIALLGHTLASAQAGRFDAAEAALQAVLAHPFHAVCRWHHWLAGLIEAQLAQQRGDLPRALAALQRAFEVGRACGFDFGPMPFCCGDMMPRLASLALDHGIDPPFALHLIRQHALPAPADASEQWPGPIRLRILGRFAIERDGAPAAPVRKESRKPLDLLKLLVALDGGPVPVDRLCAALWPDAEGDAARNSFDNTLHRLRKLLGGERCLPLQAGGLGLDARHCWTDAAALQACLAGLDTLQRQPADADPAPTLALAERALALYLGPLLAGDEDLPLVLAARARLEARFTRQMARSGEWLEAAGQAAEAARLYARGLEVQPLAEDLCRHLMACLIGLGRRAEAFAAYRHCRQQLSLLLNLRPDAATEALADSIRDA